MTNSSAQDPFRGSAFPPHRTSVIARFAWRQRRGHLVTVGLSVVTVILTAFAVAAWRGTLVDGLLTWDFWEPTLQFSILAVACLVWWGEVAQDWENSLPRRLTVWFLYPHLPTDTGESARPIALAGALGRVALLCKEAYLSDEGDIRAWGQSIGLQMAGRVLLAFQPDILQTPCRLVWRKEEDPFLDYHVLFHLTDIPTEKGRPPDERFAASQLLLWERGRPQPVWETGGWLMETPHGWELVRTANRIAKANSELPDGAARKDLEFPVSN